jgi:hypothetical protein
MKGVLYSAIEKLGDVPPTTSANEDSEAANTCEVEQEAVEDEPTECEQEGAISTEDVSLSIEEVAP